MLNVAQILGFYSYSNKLNALLQKANISQGRGGKCLSNVNIFQDVYEKKSIKAIFNSVIVAIPLIITFKNHLGTVLTNF